MRELAGKVDVIVENFRPGACARVRVRMRMRVCVRARVLVCFCVRASERAWVS